MIRYSTWPRVEYLYFGRLWQLLVESSRVKPKYSYSTQYLTRDMDRGRVTGPWSINFMTPLRLGLGYKALVFPSTTNLKSGPRFAEIWIFLLVMLTLGHFERNFKRRKEEKHFFFFFFFFNYFSSQPLKSISLTLLKTSRKENQAWETKCFKSNVGRSWWVWRGQFYKEIGTHFKSKLKLGGDMSDGSDGRAAAS